MTDPPRAVAVVLNWCGEEDTAACIRSLQDSDYRTLEILLVDNGSPDGSGPRLRDRFPELPYLQTGENLGYTGGNNRGIRWALDRGADYVLVLNNDTVVEPDAVTRLVEAAASREGVAAVNPKILYHGAPDRTWFAGGRFSALRGLGLHLGEGEPDNGGPPPPGPAATTFVEGCCLLLAADAVREVGAFAEDFFAYVEDAELSVRLRRAGFQLLYEPRARVYHRKPLDPGPPRPQAIYLRDRNRRRLMRRHFGPLRRAAFWAWYGPTRLIRMAQHLVRGDGERAGAVLRGMLDP